MTELIGRHSISEAEAALFSMAKGFA